MDANEYLAILSRSKRLAWKRDELPNGSAGIGPAMELIAAGLAVSWEHEGEIWFALDRKRVKRLARKPPGGGRAGTLAESDLPDDHARLDELPASTPTPLDELVRREVDEGVSPDEKGRHTKQFFPRPTLVVTGGVWPPDGTKILPRFRRHYRAQHSVVEFFDLYVTADRCPACGREQGPRPSPTCTVCDLWLSDYSDVVRTLEAEPDDQPKPSKAKKGAKAS